MYETPSRGNPLVNWLAEGEPLNLIRNPLGNVGADRKSLPQNSEKVVAEGDNLQGKIDFLSAEGDNLQGKIDFLSTECDNLKGKIDFLGRRR